MTTRAREEVAGRAPSRPRRWVRRLLWALGVYLAVCFALSVASAVFAWRGISELRALRREVGPAELLDGTAGDRLRDAERDLGRAAALVGGPWFAPATWVPGLGRQVDAFRSMVVGSAAVTEQAVAGVEAARAVVADGVPTGAGRVDALRRVAGVAEATAAELAAVDAGPQSWLLPGLSGAARSFADEKDGVEESLLRARDASTALASILDGPSTYLFFAANNAEMRAGSGMLLSAGLLTAADGRLEVSELEPTEDLVLAQGVGLADADLDARWGFAGPDRDFRNLLLSPRFAPSAETATRMWAALGRPPVDGVLTVDVLALEDLLAAVGPVTVGTERIDHTNVRRLLLHDQYTRVPDDREGQEARRDVLGAVAEAVLERFDEAAPDAGALARALADAAAGRHLMVWSQDEVLDLAWRGVGVAGELAPDGVLVSVLNDGNNKLDQYLDIRAELVPEDARTGALHLRVTNEVGPDEPRYVSGAFPEHVGGYGIYPGRLTVSFPAGTELTVEEGPEAEVIGSDGATEALAAPVRIPPGERVRWTVRYVLGQDLDALRILPSARAPGIRWRAGASTWSDERVPSRAVALP